MGTKTVGEQSEMVLASPIHESERQKGPAGTKSLSGKIVKRLK